MADLETNLLIGGEKVAGEGAAIEVENPYTEEGIVTLSGASPEQVDAAVAAARSGFKAWESTPATERADMLHEVAARLRARTDDLAALMTSEGGKPVIENADEVGWMRGRLRLLRGDRARLSRPRDPADRGLAARARGEGRPWRRRLHRAVELPAASADLEACARSCGGQFRHLQAVRGDAALHSRDRRRASTTCLPAP